MLATRPAVGRCIELVPALLVSLLHDCGKLPPIPNLPEPGSFAFRRPTLDDMQSVSWLAAWESAKVDRDGFRRVSGLATFRDGYDWHRSEEVREILALRGSRRACIELTRWLIADGIERNRRTVGTVANGDEALVRTMRRLGALTTRRFMEHQT